MAKKKKIGLYPGTFNPFHSGHENVLDKALEVFDRVVIAQQVNPNAPLPYKIDMPEYTNVEIITYDIKLQDLIEKIKPNGIIKGLRNTNDFIAEQAFQYLMNDLGIEVPVLYFIADRDFIHLSSTTMRELLNEES